MRKRQIICGLSAVSLCVLSATTVPAQSGVARDPSTARFLASAYYVKSRQNGDVLAFDYATRCAALLKNGAHQPILLKIADSPADASVWRHTLDATVEMNRLLAGERPADDGTCLDRIRGYYSTVYEADIRELGALARHAIATLQGADIVGPNGTASPQAVEATIAARARIAGKITKPIFLGAIRSTSKTIIIIGEPAAPYRWLVQYGNLGPGKWQFEGGVDGGYPSEQ